MLSILGFALQVIGNLLGVEALVYVSLGATLMEVGVVGLCGLVGVGSVAYSGEWGVGYVELELAQCAGRVAVFYPTRQPMRELTVPSTPYGSHTTRALAAASSLFGGRKTEQGFGPDGWAFPHCLFAFMQKQFLPVQELARSHPEARFTPVLFQHGLHSHRRLHAATCIELASNGCVVFAKDYSDGSCVYYQDKQGKGHSSGGQPHTYTPGHREPWVHHRVKESQHLLDLMQAGIPQLQALDVHFDMAKLTLAGHSFGSLASIALAHEDPRVKCLALFDAWFFPKQQQVLQGLYQLTQPIMIAYCDSFHSYTFDNFGFDSLPVVMKFFECCKNPVKLHYSVPNTTHYTMTDIQLFLGFEMSILTKGRPFLAYPEEYMGFNYMLTKFLNDNNFLDLKDTKKPNLLMSKMPVRFDLV